MSQTVHEADTPFIPQDVALMVVRENIPLVKAWRIRLNLTVEEIAAASGLHPDLLITFEKQENAFCRALLDVARAMNLDVDQIIDITN